MPSADNSLSPGGQPACDVLVAGGGIMGLWGAVRAAQAGLSVILIDAGRIGSGASGGLMGALFPWMPDRWDDKKQYQFEALTGLPAALAPLEAATGLSAHYARVGRVIPLPKPHLRPIHERLSRDAELSWRQAGHDFAWTLADAPAASHVAPEFTAAGLAIDTLAARASPRALTALLHAWLAAQPGVTILEQAELAGLDAFAGRATILQPGQGSDPTPGKVDATIAFSHLLVAAGVASFPILQSLLPPMPKPLGQGVKGQAALLAAELDPSLPVVFLDGLYVVIHEGGRVAVGSTSENTYAEPFATDHQLESVIAKARALIPALRDAPVIERWAGIRPKAIGRDPLVGRVPGHANIIALTGGFKISFGIAHRLADAAIDLVLDRQTPGLPASFTLAGQLAAIGC